MLERAIKKYEDRPEIAEKLRSRTIRKVRLAKPSEALTQVGIPKWPVASRCGAVSTRGFLPRRSIRSLALFLSVLTLLSIPFPSAAWGQTTERITAVIDRSQSVTLKGSLSPKIRSSVDEGPVDPLFSLSNIRMSFRRTPEQQAAMNQLLSSQQDPSSPNFHKWLTGEQLGDRFGLSESDITIISRWLQSEGFSIVEIARARNWIAFSGTAGQVQHTFNTQIHRVTRDKEDFFANVTEVSIPNALEGVIAGFLGLDNFRPKSAMVRAKARPAYTGLDGNNYLSPDDLATIYNLGPLYTAGIDGTGQKIAIIGGSDIHMSDIEQFRSGFGLPENDPSDVLATGCVDPGFTAAEGEADLDLEWSGAVARNASITYIKCDQNHGGILNALAVAIENNIAPTISMSFSDCEADPTLSSIQTQYEQLLQIMNAQGQTLMVSTGDAGAAGCDNHNDSGVTGEGVAVNGYASPPEATAVGGTEFNGDFSNQGQYWESTNGTTLSSAKSYIPEVAWNDSYAGTGLLGDSPDSLAATGGGASNVYKKPSFQTGPGVPQDGARDIPDISMAASPQHDGYIVCQAGSCATGIDAAVANDSVIGGTSAATPVFAGIVALLNQSLGNDSNTGLGNINTTLYSYAQSTPTAFNDIPAAVYGHGDGLQSGNEELCEAATPNCNGGILGYYTAAGYDLATGLGSVNGDVFVNQWPGAGTTKTATNTSADLNPNSITAGSTTSVILSATVLPASGSGTPTGTVAFSAGAQQIGQANLNSGKASVGYDASQLAAGTYSITAVYSGDSKFSGSTSPAVVLTVTPAVSGLKSTTTALVIAGNPSSSQADAGSTVTFTATVTASGGTAVPTGTVKFTSGSTVLSSNTLNSSGSATFSSSSLTANQYSVTAVYSGDSSYSGSSSSPAPLNIVDFQISASPSSITIAAPGQSGTAALAITPLDGFSQSLSFTCSGLPAGSACSFASTSTGSSVSISTTGAVSTSARQATPSLGGDPLYALALPGLVGLTFSGFCRRRLRALHLPMTLGAFILASLLVACGGSSGGGSGGGGSSTPPGTSTVTVTAAAGLFSHQTTITLIVQ